MKKLFNKKPKDERKDEKVYIIDVKCYDIAKDIAGPFLTNEISIYRNEQEAKDAIKRKIDDIKNCCVYTNVDVDDRFEDIIFITYSYSYDPSQSFKLVISMLERKFK